MHKSRLRLFALVHVRQRCTRQVSRHFDFLRQLPGMFARADNLLTADERLAEIAEILATGLMRLRARKSSGISADAGECSLDVPEHQSGHANPDSPEITA